MALVEKGAAYLLPFVKVCQAYCTLVFGNIILNLVFAGAVVVSGYRY